MSYESGMAAFQMQMTDTIPRTEYSVHKHWSLLREVTGIDTSITENRPKAQQAFIRAWDYGFFWTTYVDKRFFARNGGRYTTMGHALYSESQEGDSDYDDTIQQPFSGPEEVFSLDPFEEFGEFDRPALVKEIEDAYDAICTRFPDTINTGGVYITLFSGFIDMFGWELLLLSLGTDYERFGRFVERYYQWVKQFYEAYAESNIPVIMSHDDLCWTSGPVVHLDWYRNYIFPYLKRLWAPLREAGKTIIFTSDGDWTALFDDIIECGADVVVMEPTTDMGLFAEKYGKSHGFVGNADTRILLHGTKEEIYAEVKRCIDIGRDYPGFILAVGNHIPPNTPVENCLIYQEAYEKLRKR